MNKFLRFFINRRNRKKLKNQTPTIFASDCNGTFIMHDLGLQFRTPTVNLFFSAGDFVKFLGNVKGYLGKDLQDAGTSSSGYPLGRLDDIIIHFVHYADFAVAKEKWLARARRIDFNNVFVIMTDRNGCTYEIIREFDALPYPNKVIFTHKPYPEFTSAKYLPDFSHEECVGVLSGFKNKFGKRYLDEFDYIGFLNQYGKH